jgi:hypothetical protein
VQTSPDKYQTYFMWQQGSNPVEREFSAIFDLNATGGNSVNFPSGADGADYVSLNIYFFDSNVSTSRSNALVVYDMLSGGFQGSAYTTTPRKYAWFAFDLS